jgi:Holliday junction resolvase RusA-like endonuclease
MIWEQTIYGQPYSKCNSRQLIPYPKPRIIKSKNALQYEKDMLTQIKKPRQPLFIEPVKLTITIWYKSKRPDLDITLIMDILEKANIYQNDRQVYEQHIYKRFDKTNPRTDIKVELLADD